MEPIPFFRQRLRNLSNPLESPSTERNYWSMRPSTTWDFENLDVCPICESSRFNVIYEKSIRDVPLRFVKCSRCRLVFQNPRFTRDTLAKYFSSSFFIKDADSPDSSLEDLLGYFDYEAWDASYKRTAGLRLKRIRRFVRPQDGFWKSARRRVRSSTRRGRQVMTFEVSICPRDSRRPLDDDTVLPSMSTSSKISISPARTTTWCVTSAASHVGVIRLGP